jgi:hypothetical protein
MEQLGSHWNDFHEILYLIIFGKPLKKIQVSLNVTRITGFLEWEIFHTKVEKKIKTHNCCSITYPPPEKPAVMR